MMLDADGDPFAPIANDVPPYHQFQRTRSIQQKRPLQGQFNFAS
jgi:hypothetical protein